MPNVLNGPVKPGDLVAYSVRRYWAMATRIGVVVDYLEPVRNFEGQIIHDGSLKVRAVKSSDDLKAPTHLVWLTELDRVVKVREA